MFLPEICTSIGYMEPVKLFNTDLRSYLLRAITATEQRIVEAGFYFGLDVIRNQLVVKEVKGSQYGMDVKDVNKIRKFFDSQKGHILLGKVHTHPDRSIRSLEPSAVDFSDMEYARTGIPNTGEVVFPHLDVILGRNGQGNWMYFMMQDAMRNNRSTLMTRLDIQGTLDAMVWNGILPNEYYDLLLTQVASQAMVACEVGRVVNGRLEPLRTNESVQGFDFNVYQVN